MNSTTFTHLAFFDESSSSQCFVAELLEKADIRINGERFYRMWRYYLLSCAGAFRARDIQLWQFVLSKKGVGGGYHRVSHRE